ncbi:MAG: CFI-box-CTERM domain-containing protein [Bacteroidia bacterium]|nr:CFI-box-CTERM domain-containing protein [Bacteroidia bacterium]
MKKSQNPQKAIEVGRFITEKNFQAQTEAYQAAYPEFPDSFQISRELFEEVLFSAPAIKGIRFMHGLKDSKNPASMLLFLIPCTNTSEYDMASKALLQEGGYYDSNGKIHSLKEIAQLMSNYVQHIVERDSQAVYKKVIRGNFFGKEKLENLLDDTDCAFIQYYMGMKVGLVKGLMNKLNVQHEAYDQVFLNFPRPCPTSCPGPGPGTGGEDCFTTLSAQAQSQETELDFYRSFRDKELLKYEKGAMLYEMYYFISPLIASLIKGKANSQTILTKIYLDKMVPFKQLLLTKQYQKAVYLLEDSLDEMAREYAAEKLY